GEGVGQAREATDAHAHREVLPLDIACVDVCRVGVTADRRGDRADAYAGRVTATARRVPRAAVELLKLRVIDLAAEGIPDSPQVRPVAIARQLDAGAQALRHVLHERVSLLHVASADTVGRNEFRIGVDGNPRPHVAPALLRLLGADVLL